MPGRADYHQDPNPRRLNATVRALARFHVAAAGAQPTGQPDVPAALLRRRHRLQELLGGRAQQLAAAVQASPPSPLRTCALSVIELDSKLAPLVWPSIDRVGIRVPLQPCIRDVRHDHVLLTGDEVTGLVDFGAMDTDTVATDIARLLGSLVVDDQQGWRDALTTYDAVRPLSPAERHLVFALDRANVALAGWQWIQWLFAEEKRFEEEAPVVQRLEQIVLRMQWLLEHPPAERTIS
jgi:Ser/Thr protein kinase RdoA (MazF antagonist)